MKGVVLLFIKGEVLFSGALKLRQCLRDTNGYWGIRSSWASGNRNPVLPITGCCSSVFLLCFLRWRIKQQNRPKWGSRTGEMHLPMEQGCYLSVQSLLWSPLCGLISSSPAFSHCLLRLQDLWCGDLLSIHTVIAKESYYSLLHGIFLCPWTPKKSLKLLACTHEFLVLWKFMSLGSDLGDCQCNIKHTRIQKIYFLIISLFLKARPVSSLGQWQKWKGSRVAKDTLVFAGGIYSIIKQFDLEIRIAICHRPQPSLQCRLVDCYCSGVLCQMGCLNATVIQIITSNANHVITCSSLPTPNRWGENAQEAKVDWDN